MRKTRSGCKCRENTTQDLIEDIDRLRDHAGIAGRAVLVVMSWGVTLALAYAEQHPERVAGLVLQGVFLFTPEQVDFRYHGGVSMFFPDAWERFRLVLLRPDDADYPRQLFEAITGGDPRERALASGHRHRPSVPTGTRAPDHPWSDATAARVRIG